MLVRLDVEEPKVAGSGARQKNEPGYAVVPSLAPLHGEQDLLEPPTHSQEPKPGEAESILGILFANRLSDYSGCQHSSEGDESALLERGYFVPKVLSLGDGSFTKPNSNQTLALVQLNVGGAGRCNLLNS